MDIMMQDHSAITSYAQSRAQALQSSKNQSLKSQSTSSLLSLPQEVWLKIFSFLPRQELIQARAVCSIFNTFATDNSIWRDMTKDLSISNVAHASHIFDVFSQRNKLRSMIKNYQISQPDLIYCKKLLGDRIKPALFGSDVKSESDIEAEESLLHACNITRGRESLFKVCDHYLVHLKTNSAPLVGAKLDIYNLHTHALQCQIFEPQRLDSFAIKNDTLYLLCHDCSKFAIYDISQKESPINKSTIDHLDIRLMADLTTIRPEIDKNSFIDIQDDYLFLAYQYEQKVPRTSGYKNRETLAGASVFDLDGNHLYDLENILGSITALKMFLEIQLIIGYQEDTYRGDKKSILIWDLKTGHLMRKEELQFSITYNGIRNIEMIGEQFIFFNQNDFNQNDPEIKPQLFIFSSVEQNTKVPLEPSLPQTVASSNK